LNFIKNFILSRIQSFIFFQLSFYLLFFL